VVSIEAAILFGAGGGGIWLHAALGCGGPPRRKLAYYASGTSMNRILIKLRNSAAFIKAMGLKRFGREIYHRLVNDYYERRLRIQTANNILLSDIGLRKLDSRDYLPIGYSAFFSMLRRVPLVEINSTLLDFGAGQGRVVCAAATFPFQRIIGVEISEVLLASARSNLSRMRHRKAQHVELILGDAAAFRVPDDANVIHMFNPFVGVTLQRVVENIRVSIRASPRKVYIVFFNNDHFDSIVMGQPWIRKSYQTQFYPDISCGLYETMTE